MSLTEAWRDKVARVDKVWIEARQEYAPVWTGDSEYLLITHELMEELLGGCIPYDAIGLPFMAGPFLLEIVDLDCDVVLVRRRQNQPSQISPSVL